MPRLHTHSQHFLRSPSLVHELVGHSNLRINDLVYDLGAGSGVITSVLAQRCRQVVAVEIELQALAKLRRNTERYSNVEIVEKDILALQIPEGRYKVFSNIPFSLSSPILKRLATASNPPAAIYLIVQRQFARKIVPSDRHFTNLLGSQLAPWWQARIRKPLRRTDFTPPPAVDTVLLELRPHEAPLLPETEQAKYRSFVEQCYKNQTYFSSLPRAQEGINPERKPSEISPAQWVALYNSIK